VGIDASGRATIISLRSRFEEIAQEEAKKILDSLPDAGEKEKKAIDLLAHNIVNKLLHEPTTMLKYCAENGQEDVAQACRVLFKLHSEAEKMDAEADLTRNNEQTNVKIPPEKVLSRSGRPNGSKRAFPN